MQKLLGYNMDDLVEKQIDKMLKRGQTVREIFNTCNQIDMLVIERMAYFKFGIPKMKEKGDRLSEDEQNNCIIDMYQELDKLGKVYKCKD